MHDHDRWEPLLGYRGDRSWLGAGRDAILSDRLLEFAVASILLNPEKSAQAAMMSMANEMIAGVLRSGWLERNVVKIQ